MAPAGSTGVSFLPDTNCADYADRVADSEEYDIPSCVIVGNLDYSSNVKNIDGYDVITGIEDYALELIFEFNEIETGEADYASTPYWGYAPDSKYTRVDKDIDWVVHDFYKDGYASPFIELVTFVGAGHANGDYMATIAWDFMSRYSRAADGSVVEGELAYVDCSPSDWFFDAVNSASVSGLLVGK